MIGTRSNSYEFRSNRFGFRMISTETATKNTPEIALSQRSKSDSAVNTRAAEMPARIRYRTRKNLGAPLTCPRFGNPRFASMLVTLSRNWRPRSRTSGVQARPTQEPRPLNDRLSGMRLDSEALSSHRSVLWLAIGLIRPSLRPCVSPCIAVICVYSVLKISESIYL